MVGVNQVIMLALNMVIIASMIGAGGLGYDVLLALRALKVGEAMEAGLAIVALAIVLDRLSQAAARQQSEAMASMTGGPSFWRRYPNLTLALAVLAVTTLLSLVIPGLRRSAEGDHLHHRAGLEGGASTGSRSTSSTRSRPSASALLLYVLNPVRAFCEGFPWLGAVFLLGLAGCQLGGVRLAALVAALTAFCAVTGLWEKTMATVYLCGISALIACLIGIPLGLAASRSDRVREDRHADHRHAADAAVLLLHHPGGDAVPRRRRDRHDRHRRLRRRAGDPLHQSRHPPGAAGADRGGGGVGLHASGRLFWRVQLPLALPEIMLGINQTILMALA